MADRILKWEFTGSLLKVTELANKTHTKTFDFLKLYPMWNDFNHAQKGICENGLRQRFADKTQHSGGTKMTVKERFTFMTDTFNNMVDNGTYRKPTIGGLTALERDFQTLADMRKVIFDNPALDDNTKKVITDQFEIGGRDYDTLVKAIKAKKAEAEKSKSN